MAMWIPREQALLNEQERLLDMARFTKSESDYRRAHPDNIIGLPRLLTRDDGKHLFAAVRMYRRQDRQALLTDAYMRKWARERSLGLPKPGGKMACAFYADMRYRRLRLSDVVKVLDHEPGVLAAGKLSLDFNVLMGPFEHATQGVGQMDDQQWERIAGEISEDPGMSECSAAIYTGGVNRLSTTAILVLYELNSLLGQWSTLDSGNRERAILGLVLLLTTSASLTPITWAIGRVPELATEFADLRVVYRRTGPRAHAPTLRQTRKIRRLWRSQRKALSAQLSRLYSQPPSSARALQLSDQARTLILIHKARIRHRRLQAQPRNA